MRLRDLYRDRAVWLYAVLTAAFFHGPLTTQTFFFRDYYNFYYPKKVLLATALRQGTFPLWDPFTNGGRPFLATPSYAALQPSNLLYLVLPPLVATNWILVLHYFFCAVAAYWLARVVGLSRVPAFVCGIAFAFAGVTLSCAHFFGVLALPWVPLTIGLVHRALRDGRSIVPAVFAAAMPVFGNMFEVVAILFATLLVWLIAMHGVEARRRATAFAVVLAGALGLSLVIALPATSVIEQASRAEKRSWESFTKWSLHPRRLPELVVPQYFGPTDTLDDRDYRGGRWESAGFPLILSIYFGAPLLALAAIAAPRHRALALFALFGIVLSLGRNLPGFRAIYDYVPLVTIFRYPQKAMLVPLLPVALLAAFTVERVPRQRGAVLLAAMVTIDLLFAGYRVNAYAPRELFDEPPLAAEVRRSIGPLRFYREGRPTTVRAPENHVRWLAKAEIETLADGTGATFGIPVVYNVDIDLLAPRAVAQITHVVSRLPWPQKKRLLDAAGVRVILTPETLPLPEIARVEQLHLYRNDDAQPARFIGRCAGAARLVRRDLALARYEVDAPCDGRVVFSETHYDGWHATVDGREVPQRRANYAFTSVDVTKGRHTIERRYFPPRLMAGLAGTLVTAILLLVGQQLARRRQQARLVG